MSDNDIYFVPYYGFILKTRNDVVYNIDPDKYIDNDPILHFFEYTTMFVNDDNGVRKNVYLTDMFGHVIYNIVGVKFLGNITNNKRVKEEFINDGYIFAGVFDRNKKPYFINKYCEMFSIGALRTKVYVSAPTVLNYEKSYYSSYDVYFFPSVGFVSYDRTLNVIDICDDVYYTKPSRARNFEFTGIVYIDDNENFHKLISVKLHGVNKFVYVYRSNIYYLEGVPIHIMFRIHYKSYKYKLLTVVPSSKIENELIQIKKRLISKT